MTDAPTTAPINISLNDFDGDEDEITRGALTVMLNHGGLARTLVDGILELVPDPTLWRLTISGNMGRTVDVLTGRGADNPFTTARGAGHVGGITLTRNDGTFDIVISGNTLVATREDVGSPEALLEHTLRNGAHLARHEAGHAALALRGEDSGSYRDVTGLTPTDDAHRPHLALHIEDHRIERYTAVHAPSPFMHAEHLTDAIAHLRRELNYSKQHWHDDICPASSIWQDFFSFEVGDGGVGKAQVHVHRPVPGDRLVRTDLVVFDPVVLSAFDERHRVGDLVEEQPLVLQRPEPAFA